MRTLALVAFAAVGCGGGSGGTPQYDAMSSMSDASSQAAFDAQTSPIDAPSAATDAQGPAPTDAGIATDAPPADASVSDAGRVGLVWDVGSWDLANWQ